MNEIKIDSHRMHDAIEDMKKTLDSLEHKANVVINIPEINAMNPLVDMYHSHADNTCRWGGWTATFQFDKCYARIFDTCRVYFVHYDDNYLNGRKDELVPYYNDGDLIKIFKEHVDFLK